MIQELAIALAVLASALYAAARLAPTALVERAFSRLDVRAPTLSALLRRFTGRRRPATGARGARACSACPAAGEHPPRYPAKR